MKFAVTKIVLIFTLFSIVVSDVNAQRGNQNCRINRRGPPGRCMLLSRCPIAIEQIRQNLNPQICSFEGIEPIVCCPRKAENIETPQPNTYPSPSPPGIKAKKKCEEYGNIKIEAKLGLTTTIVGGIKASAQEFPHMAAIGFGEENDIQWSCGGTLISEEYVLTAAHCLFSQQLGDAKFVRLGDLNIKSKTDEAGPQDFRVASAINNPIYSPPSQYNDIALIKLDRPAVFTKYVQPACLQTDFQLPQDSTPIAIGWGRVGYTDEASDDLMKVNLQYFTNEQCRKSYANVPERRLPKGIDDDIQLCAGGVGESKDTCQGDSGGPLQIKSPTNPKQYYVIGITSFGKGCGTPNIPGVYTRVSSYIYWIEETVWPNA